MSLIPKQALPKDELSEHRRDRSWVDSLRYGATVHESRYGYFWFHPFTEKVSPYFFGSKDECKTDWESSERYAD